MNNYINTINSRYRFAANRQSELSIELGENIKKGFWFVNGSNAIEHLRKINQAARILEYYRVQWCKSIGI